MRTSNSKCGLSLLSGSLLYLLLAGQLVYPDYATGLHAYTHYDYQAARKEFTRVALDGHSEAQHYLGEIYEGGVGVPIDYEQAFAWYTQAAQQEHAAAQSRLAALYLKGWGVKQDATSAFGWYLRSAGNGYPLAQFETGMMYAHGQGTPPDKIEAYRWLTIAASYGDPDAMGARERLAAAMTPVETSRAARLAMEWEIAREREQR